MRVTTSKHTIWIFFLQVLKDCIVQVCVTRPDNPIAYLREYFQKLERQIAKESKAGPLSPDDEAESPIPPVQSQFLSVRRRGAISAEAITEEDASSYVKKVVWHVDALKLNTSSELKTFFYVASFLRC